MKHIYKYPLQNTAQQLVDMPFDAEILDAQMQGNILTLWVLRSISSSTKRIINVFMTGEAVNEEMGEHIATVQHKGLVLHVFDGGNL